MRKLRKLWWWLRFNRLMRWRKCRHRWQKYTSEIIPLADGTYLLYETLDLRKPFQFCPKCREVRTVGKPDGVQKYIFGSGRNTVIKYRNERERAA